MCHWCETVRGVGFTFHAICHACHTCTYIHSTETSDSTIYIVAFHERISTYIPTSQLQQPAASCVTTHHHLFRHHRHRHHRLTAIMTTMQWRICRTSYSNSEPSKNSRCWAEWSINNGWRWMITWLPTPPDLVLWAPRNGFCWPLTNHQTSHFSSLSWFSVFTRLSTTNAQFQYQDLRHNFKPNVRAIAQSQGDFTLLACRAISSYEIVLNHAKTDRLKLMTNMP